MKLIAMVKHLKARSGSLARKHTRLLILDWLKLYKNYNNKTWELEVLSRRVSAWITNFDFLLAEKDKKLFRYLIKKSFQTNKIFKKPNQKSFFFLEKNMD